MLSLFRRLRTLGLLSLTLLSPWHSPAQFPNLSEQYLLSAANRDRIAHDLRPVRLDNSLTAAAFQHAQSMALHRTISHQFSGEADLAARAAVAGVRFSLVTENVAEASNSALIHDLWMKSAGHRANLLDPRIDSVGIAVVYAGGQLFAVEDFARIVEPLTLHEQETQVASLIQRAGIELLTEVADARETCRMGSGYAGTRMPWFVMRYTAADLSRLPEQLVERLATGKYHHAAVGACDLPKDTSFSSYSTAVLLYP